MIKIAYILLEVKINAKLNINIFFKIKDNKYEGITKVQNDGRFTYYNPPNFLSYEIIDEIKSYYFDIIVTYVRYLTTIL